MSIYRVAPKAIISVGEFNKIESLAIHYDWNLAFAGRSRGNGHLFRTVRLVKKLWSMLYPEPGDKAGTDALGELDVAVAGALMHDIGLVYGNKSHCFSGRQLANELLDSTGIDSKVKKRILHCIEAHDGEVEARTIEAKLVHDADTIDKMGPLGAIRHIWKLSLLGDKKYSLQEYLTEIPEHLKSRFNNLYLKESRELAEPLNEALSKMFNATENSGKLVEYIKTSASTGIPVDEMLPGLLEKNLLDPDVVDVLEKQIRVDLGT